MRRDTFRGFAWLLATSVLLLAGCGSSSSSDAEPSSPAETILLGKVVAGKAAHSHADMMTLAAGDPIDVMVQEQTSIKATVAADGTFTLRGLPAGSFTLVFTQTGVVIGTLEFEEVAVNQQITINVEVVDGEVVLVDEDRRGIGHAGIELEGLVQMVLTLNLTGDSRFMIAGRTVIARPGVTAIRQGTTRKTVEDLKVGMQVHVKGTTLEGSTEILAYEIKIQGPGSETGEEKVTICHIPPGNPSKKKTLTIGASAWPAHQGHGDTLGPC